MYYWHKLCKTSASRLFTFMNVLFYWYHLKSGNYSCKWREIFPQGDDFCALLQVFLPIWILTQISILLNWYIFELVTVLNQSDEKVVQVVQLIQGFHLARLRQIRISEFPKNWVFAKIPWVFGEKSLSFCTLLSFWVKNCWVLLNHSVFKQFFWLVSWQCSFNIWILF